MINYSELNTSLNVTEELFLNLKEARVKLAQAIKLSKSEDAFLAKVGRGRRENGISAWEARLEDLNLDGVRLP